MVVWREPPEDRAIQFSVVKELTGGSKINARALYSNDVETHIDACFLMECFVVVDVTFVLYSLGLMSSFDYFCLSSCSATFMLSTF